MLAPDWGIRAGARVPLLRRAVSVERDGDDLAAGVGYRFCADRIGIADAGAVVAQRWYGSGLSRTDAVIPARMLIPLGSRQFTGADYD
ncbi:hypothetical protein D9M69_701500 [compost metagenome]